MDDQRKDLPITQLLPGLRHAAKIWCANCEVGWEVAPTDPTRKWFHGSHWCPASDIHAEIYLIETEGKVSV